MRNSRFFYEKPKKNEKRKVSSGSAPKKPKLLDQVSAVIRCKHYSIRTEQAYIDWIKKFIFFHGKRHPAEMGEKEIADFLSYLAVKKKVAASTQNQALCAIVFLYRQVLQMELGNFENLIRAKKPTKMPVVFTGEEVKKILVQLEGRNWLMGQLLYGAGLRLMECVRLRVKDIDFGYNQIIVRDGKGHKDRVTMLPGIVIDNLRTQFAKVKIIHDRDLKNGYGAVYLPYALERKYRNANRSWAWQYVFPANRRSVDPRSQIERRHHISESVIQRAVKEAIRQANIQKPA